MSKIKSLLLASSVCIATVCINFPAHATERHLLEQTVSYEELGNVLRYRQSWVEALHLPLQAFYLKVCK